jgi:hypothetical protein
VSFCSQEAFISAPDLLILTVQIRTIIVPEFDKAKILNILINSQKMDKNIYKFIFYLVFFISFESRGQIMFTDTFESGLFGNWGNTAQWNISNQSPITGKYSLHHNLTGTRSTSFISRKITATGFNNGLITWNFKIKNGNWVFGATEQLCFFLISDRADITTSNGYAIGINLNGGDNVLKLCRMEKGIAVQDIVRTDLVWKAGMLLEVEVSHEYGLWKVRYRDGATATWSAEKTGSEKLLNFSYSNIGLLYKFNTAHGGQVWVDDVSMNYQNLGPSIHEARSTGRNQILILFSETIAQTTLLKPDNYQIKTAGGTLVSVMSVRKAAGDTAGVYLQLGNFNQYNLHLTVNNLTDTDGMALSVKDFDFTFIPTARFGDIVFNEIMADPVPVVKLPDKEYLELINTSGFSINLKNWILEVNGKQKILSDKTVGPGNYLIVSGTGGNTVFGSYGSNLEVTGLSLANDGVILKLYSATSALIDSFYYSPIMHRKEFADGGYSLERIDPMRSCGAGLNWETTISENGGTPGSVNSVFADNKDDTPPIINSVVVANPSLLEIVVSEAPDKQSMAGDIFAYSPSLPVPDSIRFDRKLLKYSVYFPKGAVKDGVNYDLTINGLADECGNRTPIIHREFWYYLPKPGNLLINEVLFNPFAGGVDFVEIYNHSGRKIELSDIYLGSRDDNQKIKSLYPLSGSSAILLGAEYAAFTSDSATLLKNYYSACPACILQMGKLPAYNQDEGWVVLMNKEMGIIDEFHYLESMHNPLVSNTKGISLERNSFSKPTNDPSNWHSASQSAGYATPGYKNSASELISGTSISKIVTIEPKIFSPNGDGFNDRLQIKLCPGKPDMMANIRVYNENGLEIKRLANNLMIGTQDIIEWDGTTENHQKAGLGIYIIQVELFGLQGGRKQYKDVCVLTDRLE